MISLSDLEKLILEDGDGDTAEICIVDGWPTSIGCQCGHGHTRHVGGIGTTRCMSYYGQPDCSCSGFSPSEYDVIELWENSKKMLNMLKSLYTV